MLCSSRLVQLVSHDEHAGTYNYKFTFSVKLVPICKEDLCLLPHKVHHGLGGMGPVVLCTHVSSAVHLLDPFTLRQVCPPLHFLHAAPGVPSPTFPSHCARCALPYRRPRGLLDELSAWKRC